MDSDEHKPASSHIHLRQLYGCKKWLVSKLPCKPEALKWFPRGKWLRCPRRAAASSPDEEGLSLVPLLAAVPVRRMTPVWLFKPLFPSSHPFGLFPHPVGESPPSHRSPGGLWRRHHCVQPSVMAREQPAAEGTCPELSHPTSPRPSPVCLCRVPLPELSLPLGRQR